MSLFSAWGPLLKIMIWLIGMSPWKLFKLINWIFLFALDFQRLQISNWKLVEVSSKFIRYWKTSQASYLLEIDFCFTLSIDFPTSCYYFHIIYTNLALRPVFPYTSSLATFIALTSLFRFTRERNLFSWNQNRLIR